MQDVDNTKTLVNCIKDNDFETFDMLIGMFGNDDGDVSMDVNEL